MRRRLTWLAPALLALTALLSTAAPAAADVPADDVVVLAAEGETDYGSLGPAPQEREAEGNAATELAGYQEPGVQFTWAASFLLLGGAVTGLVVGGSLWYLFVLLPQKRAAATD